MTEVKDEEIYYGGSNIEVSIFGLEWWTFNMLSRFGLNSSANLKVR